MGFRPISLAMEPWEGTGRVRPKKCRAGSPNPAVRCISKRNWRRGSATLPYIEHTGFLVSVPSELFARGVVIGDARQFFKRQKFRLSDGIPWWSGVRFVMKGLKIVGFIVVGIGLLIVLAIVLA